MYASGGESAMERSVHTSGPGTGGQEQAGRYVYCVAWTGEEVSMGDVGIEGRGVYTVVHRDLAAVVHACPAQPYESSDLAVVAEWVLAHSRVVEAAWRRWGTTLPLTFNTIIRGREGTDAGEELRAWLGAEYPALRARLENLQGKAEYGVQVFWDPGLIGMDVLASSPELVRLEEEAGARSRGLAYMYRQRLERMLRDGIEARAAKEFEDLYGRLRRCADGVHVERVKSAEQGLQMLANLSCLVSGERYPDLEAELERVGQRDGFSIRLAGPLPPYSFC